MRWLVVIGALLVAFWSLAEHEEAPGRWSRGFYAGGGLAALGIAAACALGLG